MPEPAPIASWQVDLVRKALDARGLISMDERQQAIQTAAERPVESLRSLTHQEALRILAKFGEASASRTASQSAWDQRDEDTWIDRL